MAPDAVLHLPAMRGRPEPEKLLAFWLPQIPIPLHLPPKFCRAPPNFLFHPIGPIKIFPRREKALHQVRRFDQVTPIIELRKGKRCARPPIQPMRPRAVITGGFFLQKMKYSQKTLACGHPLDKPALRSDKKGHHAET